MALGGTDPAETFIIYMALLMSFLRFLSQFFLIASCVSSIQFLSSKNDTLEALERVSGVFKSFNNETRQLESSLRRTVLLTASNYGYLNHLMNFKCFMERLNMKFLVIALDKRTYLSLSEMGGFECLLMSSTGVNEDSSDFRSHQFNLITTRKKEAVFQVLMLHYDVLFSDTDVAIVRNPFPYLLWENVDYVHSLNCICEYQKSEEKLIERS